MDSAQTNGHAVVNGRAILFTIPRSCSNLLVRMLTSKQDTVKHTEYNFDPSLLRFDADFPAALSDKTKTQELWETLVAEYKAAAQKLQDGFADAKREVWYTTFPIAFLNVLGKAVMLLLSIDARAASRSHSILTLSPPCLPSSQGKIASAKEHVTMATRPEYVHGKEVMPEQHELPFFPPTAAGSSNITILPDEFLMSLTPIILIRHPALVMPSYIRVCSDSGADALANNRATLSLSRILFDWYREMAKSGTREKAPEPIVVDAADFMTSPALLRRLCAITGLDPDKIAFDWDAASAEILSSETELRKTFLKTMFSSTRVRAERAGTDINVQNEVQKWRAEFPKDVSEWMENKLPEEMEHYEYLKAHRLLPDDDA